MAADDKEDVKKKPTTPAEPRVKPLPPARDPGGVTMRWEIPKFRKKIKEDE